MTQNSNPLSKYFRQPAIHLQLPSRGKFYPPGALNMPVNNEVPVYPMTAVDEITSRTPDALFNGSAVVNIIGSCVPDIRDPWTVTAVDLNSLLCAIRLASYGHDMEISSKCPKCGQTHSFNIDLRVVLDSITMPDYDQPLVIGDLTIFFAPMNYRQINEVSRVQYEDNKVMQVVNSADISEDEKIKQLGDAFRRITALTIKSIAASVATIKTSDAMVNDIHQIEEFLINAPKTVFEQIRDRAVALRSETDLKPIQVTCDNPECRHVYQQEFTLDMSNFFETAS